MSTHEQHPAEPEVAAYALGALDLEDRAAVEALLASSPQYQDELRQLREVVALLPYAAPPVSPPDRVRQQLMARVAAAQVPQPPAAQPQPAPRPRRRWLMPAVAATLATLILALAGLSFTLAGSVARLEQGNRDLVTTLAGLQEALATTQARQEELAAELSAGQQRLAAGEERINQLNAELVASQERIGQLNAELARDDYVISFVSAPGVATRQLNATQLNAVAQGEMYMYPGNPNAVVLFSGLPALAPGQVYQFWLADGSNQVAGGTFEVDASGIGHIVVQAPREVNAFSQVMVTVEPEGGSAQPSRNVVLEGNL